MQQESGVTAAPNAAASSPRGVVRTEILYFLQLMGVCGMVFARPILDAFGRSPETFVEAGAGSKAVVVFAFGWVFVPPLVLWIVTFATRILGARVRRIAHVVVVGLLVGVFVVQAFVLGQSWPLVVIWALAVLAAGLAVFLWWRYKPMRDFLAYLAGAPVLFLVLFLLSSPASALLDDSSVRSTGSSAHVPIVLIVLDELPTRSLLDSSGHVDAANYPGFARLAASSTWYRNHTTTGSTTDRAVPAVLTGRYPPLASTAPIESNYPENLFSFLGNPYHMNSAETITSLCPDRLCHAGVSSDAPDVMDRSVDLWFERFHRSPPGAETGLFDPVAGGDQRGANFEAFEQGIQAKPAAQLDFSHLVLPHVPWELTPAGRVYDPGADIGLTPYFYTWADAESARFNRERHLTQLQYTDHLIDTLLDRLVKVGIYDKALVVVTADHGIAFEGNQPARATTKQNVDEIAWSPLFIKKPGQRVGKIDDRNAESVDVVPTIADIIGTRLPWRVDGRSLEGPARPTDTKYLVPYEQNSVPTNGDGRIVLDGDRGFREMLAAPPPMRGTDDFAALRGGPHGDIVGKPAAAVGFGASTSGRVSVDPDPLVEDPNAATVPGVVRATVDVPRGTTVALIVNDTVAGTYRPGKDHKTRFVLPQSVLRSGRNDVEIATITGADGSETLHRISGS